MFLLLSGMGWEASDRLADEDTFKEGVVEEYTIVVGNKEGNMREFKRSR